MNQPSPIIDDATHEELVAYLDGELEPQASRDVERRLATDAEYRQLLQLLSQAWDALDDLPRVQPDETFAGSTVAVVASDAQLEVDQLKSSSVRNRTLGLLSAFAGLSLAGLLSFVVTGALLPDHDKELLADLPVIENVDLYIYADSIDFLRQLDDSGLFAGEVEGETSDDS